MLRIALPILLLAPALAGAETTEFCLDGEFDLGLRLQGLSPQSGEWYDTTWCVITEDESARVIFSARGNANPDMEDNWTVAYLPPALVRIVNRDDPPDVEFANADIAAEATRVRRLDPSRLLAEYADYPEGLTGVTINRQNENTLIVGMRADLPVRGPVPAIWQWDFENPDEPTFKLELAGADLFRGTGRWRVLDEGEAAAVWERTPDADPIEVPGDRWPSAISTRLIELSEGVYLARGVRTGFQHIVIETHEGLVVGDAPAGWVEFHHLPPTDMIPDIGILGLSQRFIEFLSDRFPDTPIRAVAITHFHDDHAGGAMAFASEGATIYAPADSAAFLERMNGLLQMALSDGGEVPVAVVGVEDRVAVGDVTLVDIGAGPHADAMLGILAQDYFFVSDIHVPRDEEPSPSGGREETECWFADWAVANLSPDVQVVNSHSTVITPVSRLQQYTESDACRILKN